MTIKVPLRNLPVFCMAINDSNVLMKLDSACCNKNIVSTMKLYIKKLDLSALTLCVH